jgi:hypothetical protein
MQSAFEVADGKRFIFETTPKNIIVSNCDVEWQQISEFANIDLFGSENEYHLVLRKSYLPEYLVQERSSVIAQ